jgi:hypothetical protein
VSGQRSKIRKEVFQLKTFLWDLRRRWLHHGGCLAVAGSTKKERPYDNDEVGGLSLVPRRQVIDAD